MSFAVRPMLTRQLGRGGRVRFSTHSSSSSSSSTSSRASSSHTTAAGVVPPKRRFDPPPNNPKSFLAELLSFADANAVSRGGDLTSALPLSFSGDADLILNGARRVVTRSSDFNFSCTACGHCCKSYPNDVMLDPHDLFLVSRARGITKQSQQQTTDKKNVSPSLDFNSTLHLHRSFPKAFQGQLGLFESSEYLIEDSSNKNTVTNSLLSSQHKLAPVMFLRTKRVKQVSRSEPRTKSILIERCWFSQTIEKTNVFDEVHDVDESMNGASHRDKTIRPIRASSRPSTLPPPSSKGLTCRLGPAHQPTSCALYPLGELYTKTPAAPTETIDPNPVSSSSIASSQPPASSSSNQYWSLDVTNCEGVHVPTTPSTRTNVSGYIERNGLDQRRIEWSWFESLARRVAATGWLSVDASVSPLTHDMREELHEYIATAWYDFDAMKMAPMQSLSPSDTRSTGEPVYAFPDWSTAKAAVTRATEVILDSTRAYLKRSASVDELAARQQWRADLDRHGVARRDE